jgi:hypothetical protein
MENVWGDRRRIITRAGSRPTDHRMTFYPVVRNRDCIRSRLLSGTFRGSTIARPLNGCRLDGILPPKTIPSRMALLPKAQGPCRQKADLEIVARGRRGGERRRIARAKALTLGFGGNCSGLKHGPAPRPR